MKASDWLQPHVLLAWGLMSIGAAAGIVGEWGATQLIGDTHWWKLALAYTVLGFGMMYRVAHIERKTGEKAIL